MRFSNSSAERALRAWSRAGSRGCCSSDEPPGRRPSPEGAPWVSSPPCDFPFSFAGLSEFSESPEPSVSLGAWVSWAFSGLSGAEEGSASASVSVGMRRLSGEGRSSRSRECVLPLSSDADEAFRCRGASISCSPGKAGARRSRSEPAGRGVFSVLLPPRSSPFEREDEEEDESKEEDGDGDGDGERVGVGCGAGAGAGAGVGRSGSVSCAALCSGTASPVFGAGVSSGTAVRSRSRSTSVRASRAARVRTSSGSRSSERSMRRSRSRRRSGARSSCSRRSFPSRRSLSVSAS